jgi:hypothetical protein
MQTKYLNVFVVFVYNMSPRKTKRLKGETHSVRIDKELDEWVESMIASQEFGSWSHAISRGLTLLKEKLEKKK